MDGTASARVAARLPLLRAGLERIAHRANVDLLESGDADFVLHTGEAPAGQSGIDVAIADGVFVITCRSLPDPAVWEAVRRIIGAAVTG
jgi:hypothetical protein